MAEFGGLSSSVFAGPDVTGARQTAMDKLRGRVTSPATTELWAQATGGRDFARTRTAPGSFSTTPRVDPRAPLSFTATPKSATQNEFLGAVASNFRTNQPTRANSLAQFVRESYANQAADKSALDEERKTLDKLFAKEGGLVDELASARAKKQAGVLLKAKMAMDRAKRSNNLNRMIGGNNTYNDRLFMDAMARIGADAGMTGADDERDDLRYITGQRMGAMGLRGRLGQDYLATLMNPAMATNAAARDDLSVLEEIARLEDGNTVYESPLDQIRRELATRQGLGALDFYGE